MFATRALPLAALALCLAALLPAALAQEAKPDPATQLINQYLSAAWKAQKLQPADKTSDEEFLRRVSLDLIGRIPTVPELEAFLKDAAADKRAKLVDKLLASQEHVACWANLWNNWLIPPTAPRLYRDQLQLWLVEAITAKMPYKEMATKLLTATGKTNDNGAVNYVLAHLGESLPSLKRDEVGQFDVMPITRHSLRLFLGYRLNYDLSEKPEESDWQPKHFWSANAFFRQVERVGTPAPAGNVGVILQLKDNPEFNKKGIVFFNKADGTQVAAAPVFFDGKKLDADFKGTRREVFAELLTSHPNFAKAHINRIWGQFFSRGLCFNPVVDDFSTQNKVIHPELLDGLAKEFIDGKYDTRKLIRSICLSDAYQLKSTANATNAQPQTEVYFSRMPLRVMRPEQIVESFLTAVRPTRIKESAKVRGDIHKAMVARQGEQQWEDLQLHDQIIRAMGLLNCKEFQALVTDKESATIGDAMKLKTGKEMTDFVFLTFLGRTATAKEYAQIVAKLPLEKGLKDTEPTGAMQDLIWAVLNSNEFILNH